MAFSTRRGRPRTRRTTHDKGTPELAAKRKMHLTSEPLDICLERGHINTQQHLTGYRLRWLFTLVYGVPEARITNLGGANSSGAAARNDTWLHWQEQELRAANQALQSPKLLELVHGLCIYGRKPACLTHRLTEYSLAEQASKELSELRDGLDAIHHSWQKMQRSRKRHRIKTSQETKKTIGNQASVSHVEKACPQAHPTPSAPD